MMENDYVRDSRPEYSCEQIVNWMAEISYLISTYSVVKKMKLRIAREGSEKREAVFSLSKKRRLYLCEKSMARWYFRRHATSRGQHLEKSNYKGRIWELSKFVFRGVTVYHETRILGIVLAADGNTHRSRLIRVSFSCYFWNVATFASSIRRD